MKYKGKYYKADGTQLCVYPSEHMNITQGMFAGYSHAGRATIDDGGQDANKSNFMASFDGTISWKQTTGDMTGILLSSKKPVWVPKNGGMLAKVNIIYWHDDDTSDLYKGKTISQGEIFYQEGTAGRATGNHVHMGVSFGEYDGTYPLVKNSNGNWEIKNEEKVYDVFWINDTIIRDGEGYPWKTYTEPVTQPSVAFIIKVGMTVYWSGPLYRDSYGGGKTNTIYTKRLGIVDIIHASNKTGYHIKDKGWIAKAQITKV